MEWVVYELVNSENRIEYIGLSKRPEIRFNQHTGKYILPGMGTFSGRTDLRLNIVKTFDNKLFALRFEGKHKLANGFEWSEQEARRRGGKKGGKITGKIKHICPNCSKEITGPGYYAHIKTCQIKMEENNKRLIRKEELRKWLMLRKGQKKRYLKKSLDE